MTAKEESSMSDLQGPLRGLSPTALVEDEANFLDEGPSVIVPQNSGWFMADTELVHDHNLNVAPGNILPHTVHNYTLDMNSVSFSAERSSELCLVDSISGCELSVHANGTVRIKGNMSIPQASILFWSKVIKDSHISLRKKMYDMARDIVQVIEMCEECDGRENLCNRCAILVRTLDPQQVVLRKEEDGSVTMKVRDSDDPPEEGATFHETYRLNAMLNERIITPEEYGKTVMIDWEALRPNYQDLMITTKE